MQLVRIFLQIAMAHNQKGAIIVTITQHCANNYIQLTHKKHTR